MKEEKKRKPKTASKIVKLHDKKNTAEVFSKIHQDELNKPKERIKNNIEDGENFGGI